MLKDYNGRRVKDRWIFITYYYNIPAIVALTVVLLGASITSEISNYFITGISIFAGLFFNLLLVVADKMNVKKRILDLDSNEETKNYVIRYKHFSEQLISQISYAIVISLVLIILMFLTHFGTWLSTIDAIDLTNFISFYIPILDTVIFYFGVKFIIMLFVILSSMYVMLLDDLKIKK
ncbi:hypothetical protein [Ekhidna sp.]|uniref:hypothetical protein n=1 Tax=Ekhidna sp. TaxID=2608089 RepID=UPI0032993E21